MSGHELLIPLLRAPLSERMDELASMNYSGYQEKVFSAANLPHETAFLRLA
jgi:hypothetical protein